MTKSKITGAYLGTIVEYYDYSLYGFSAAILAAKFFPTHDLISGLINVFAIYALSYVAKPFGALFFSRIGDWYGRLVSLRITLIGIALPTLTIGLLPEYESIGSISTIILVICRLLQGFFVAGEYDGAAIYVIEHLGSKYHFTASAATRATGVVGLLLGIAVTSFFNSSMFPSWCWRIPFLLSLPLSIITLYYRSFLQETPEFKGIKTHDFQPENTLNIVKEKWPVLLLVILLAGGFGVTYQVSIIFMKQYLPIIAPASISIIKTIAVVMVMCFGAMMPISGLLADKFGHYIVIKISLYATITSLCLIIFASTNNYLNLLLMSCLLLAMSVAPFNALAHGIIVKSFPVSMRYRGVSIGHTIGSVLMSGTANVVCLSIIKFSGFTLFPLFYIGFFAIICFLSIRYLANNYSIIS